MFDFFTEKFSSLLSHLSGKTNLTNDNIAQVLNAMHETLLEADVPLKVASSFLDEIKKEVIGTPVLSKALNPAEQFAKIVYDKLANFLGGQHTPEQFNFTIPSVVLMLGLQGSGKTTTLAKLVHYSQYQAQKRGKKRSIMVASVDFYRPAALEQLKILAQQLQVTYFQSSVTNPIEASKDIIQHFKKSGMEMLFLDTAGRMHVDTLLLEEIKAIAAIVKPTYKLLVVDAMTGQESLQVARNFDQHVGFDYAIVSKMDSNTRAGAVFAFRYSLQKSILFTGYGEKIEDLERFYPNRIASRIIGKGDISSLIERAEAKIASHEKHAVEQSIKRNTITLNDFALLSSMVEKMGSLSSIVKSLPFMSKVSISETQLQEGKKEMHKFKAIISSMTMKERLCPTILDQSRRQRIAKGAGVHTTDIKNLLERFENAKQSVKILKKMGSWTE